MSNPYFARYSNDPEGLKARVMGDFRELTPAEVRREGRFGQPVLNGHPMRNPIHSAPDPDACNL